MVASSFEWDLVNRMTISKLLGLPQVQQNIEGGGRLLQPYRLLLEAAPDKVEKDLTLLTFFFSRRPGRCSSKVKENEPYHLPARPASMWER